MVFLDRFRVWVVAILTDEARRDAYLRAHPGFATGILDPNVRPSSDGLPDSTIYADATTSSASSVIVYEQ